MIDSKNLLSDRLNITPYKSADSENIEVDNFAIRALKSSTCRLIVGLGFAGCIKKITESYCPTLYNITVAALTALHIYSNSKQLIYEVTLAYPVIRSRLDSTWDWYHQVIPPEEERGGVYLGALPLKNLGHHKMLKKFAILSLVEDHEMSSQTPWSDPVTPADWTKLGTTHIQISTEDFHPVSIANIWEAVLWIEEQVSEGKNVYVHCKAGRSRSSTVVIAYLLYQRKKAGNLSSKTKSETDNVISFVRKIRPRIILFKTDCANIEEYCRSLQKSIILCD